MASEGAMKLPDSVRAGTRPIVVYEQAVRAIQECSTILEAKHWSDKSEALAAWAKIYADDRVAQEARALKLHAYRQIGRLAVLLHPQKSNGRHGMAKGARGALIEHGFGANDANTMVRIGKIAEPKFAALVNRPRPPSPSTVVAHELAPSPIWAKFRGRFAAFLSTMRYAHIDAIVRDMSDKQVDDAKGMAKEAMDALGEFQEKLWKVQQDKGESLTKPR